jgi:hypothetical protein
MKKTILLILVMAMSHLYTLGQCEDCPKDKGISTNPTNPENCEVDEAFPNKTNQMLNSFDWAKTNVPNPQPGTTFSFNAIPLNPNAGWQVPNYTSAGIFYMQSPFYQGFLNKPSNSPLADFDFAWEDGWELMYMNTGYFPNGDVYHDPTQNSNPMVAAAIPLQHAKVPYIILYNRYSGKLRTFFNIYAELGSFDDIKLDMGYINTPATDDVSGMFRHGNGYDTPLDQQTATHAFSTSFVNGNNNQQWFMADAQLGYDPCVCNYASEFRFKLQGLDSTRISLYGRSISSEVPLQGADGKPTYSNWLNMNTTDAALGSDGSGALIYKSLDGMLDDYQTEAKKYEEELADYNSLGNKAMRDLMGLAKTGLNSGITGLVPTYILKGLSTNAVRIINQKFDKKNYENAKQWYKDASSPDDAPTWSVASSSTKPEGQQAYEQMILDSKKYSNELSKNLKSGLGAMSNSLFTSLYTEPSKPTKPTMPMATLTEMKIEGSMYESTNVDIGKLYTPGSVNFGGSFSPTSYPNYNEPVGLFALLETPKLSVYSEAKVVKREVIFNGGNPKDGQGPTTIIRKCGADFSLKLTQPLKYRFNHAVDFDFDKTKVYTQIQVKYRKKKLQGQIKKVNGNFKFLHIIPTNSNGKLEITLTSDWYPTKLSGEVPIGGTWYEDVNMSLEASEIEIVQVTYKVMADMYFLSPGYGGSEKNSTHEFTYLLYDKDNNVDFIEEKGEWLTDPSSISKYKLGKLTLENELIETTDDFVIEVVGTNIYVNAEEIELKGNITVQNGYKAIIQAYWGIESDPTTEIGENIELAIKRNFYNFPETVEVDDTELGNYCIGTNKKYQANQAKAKRTVETTDDKEPEIDYAFTVYPNPSSDLLNVESDIENSTVDLLNVDGKLISTYQYEGFTGQYDVSALSAGLYFVRLQTPKGYKYLRFVKQ